MERRDFLKGSLKAGIITSAAFVVGQPIIGLSQGGKDSLHPDLIGVMGGDPNKLFDVGIQAFGGIKRFVKPNKTVVVKPNIGWDSTPDRGANTNPILIRQIVQHCKDAGAKKVYVFDHTADVWNKCYKNSGIESAAKESGALVVPGNSERYYHRISIPSGKSLKSAYVHELMLEADTFINVPVLKHHIATKLSIGMKNLMGVVWDRGWWHSNNLHQCIADFAAFRKPDLTVIDAYNVMKRNGPLGVSPADLVTMRAQILAVDPVAADTASSRLFGLNPQDVKYLRLAESMGVGSMDLSRISIKRIKI